jgi:ribonuclease HII
LKKQSTFNTHIRLDGSLKAPKEFIHQETIIKGDEKDPLIALASIVAKETRDSYMVKLSSKYPKYGFEKHKGYGTKEHRVAVKKNGLTEVHRKSYCTNLLPKIKNTV